MLCACEFLNIICGFLMSNLNILRNIPLTQIDIVDVRSYTDDINILIIKTHITAQIVSFGIYKG